MLKLLAVLILLSTTLSAELRPIGGSQVQVFDAKAKAFKPQLAVVAYQGEPEVLQVHLPGFQPGGPLNARLELQKLPHYQSWVARRKKEGGLAWSALSALLEEVQDRPAVFLSLGPLPAQGRAEIRVGLLKGSQFELYARVQGTIASSQRGTVFEVQGMVLEKASARAAWAVLQPLARKQALRAAGQR